MKNAQINQAFEYAKARYADLGIDVEKAMEQLDKLPISLHCWQALQKPLSRVSGLRVAVCRFVAAGRQRHCGSARAILFSWS